MRDDFLLGRWLAATVRKTSIKVLMAVEFQSGSSSEQHARDDLK